MKQHNYKGHTIRTYAHLRVEGWCGGYQVDGAPIVLVANMPAALDELSAHADAHGQAMSAIDNERTGRR